MDDISASKSHHSSVVLNVKDSDVEDPPVPTGGDKKDDSVPFLHVSFSFIQKLIAELLGTYYLLFAGCAAIAVNAQHNNVVTLVGIALVWGLVIMVLVYSLGHVSAHFNPAVTIAFASCKMFPLKHVPAYITVQVLGATLASATLRLLFDLNDGVCSKGHDVFIGNFPSGSDLQAFVMEFVITGFLMFVVCAMATDSRAVEQLAALVFGATVTLNVLFAGEISGASMNPARSLGPAIVWSCYKSLWIYMVSPTFGAITGAWIYNLLRCRVVSFRQKPLISAESAQ